MQIVELDTNLNIINKKKKEKKAQGSNKRVKISC